MIIYIYIYVYLVRHGTVRTFFVMVSVVDIIQHFVYGVSVVFFMVSVVAGNVF